MPLKDKIYQELQKSDFPNLQFLYSKEVLDIAQEVLEELLEKEKKDFEEKLLVDDSDISFETFDDISDLSCFYSLLEHYQGVNNDETIREIIEKFEPKYITFGNEIAYSRRYYDMIVYCLKNTKLDVEQTRILEPSKESYEVRWIALDPKTQKELKDINLQLSELWQNFSNNVLDSQKLFEYIVTDESIISEMPEDDKKVAQKKAGDTWIDGYLFDASAGSYVAIMKYCSDSEVRREFFEARNSFAIATPHDNKKTILEILTLRQKKSKLLGFKNYAELSLHFKMADTPTQVMDLFSGIAEKSRQKANSEITEIQNFFWLESISPWDMSYYARKLRQEKYNLDDRELKKYFELEAVTKGMFEIVGKLYGLKIQEVKTTSYDEDVVLYEVSREGEFLSYFFTDYFHRPLKRQGAWANILREKSDDTTAERKKIVVNVANFQKSADGKTLLTLSDVETMFHEFGHATHEMMSTSPHSELSGFHVEWDFVELPSQLLENWCRHPDGLDLFARHVESGDKIPRPMIERLQELETFGTGNMILKQNEYAMLDMLLHTETVPTNSDELDKKVHENYDANSIFPRGDVYNPHTSFSHIFDGGYAAGYYSYMWAEIIEKQVWRTFLDDGDIFSPQISKRLHDTILSQWTTKKASELFQDFSGGEVQIDAFLKEKGLLS